MAQQIPFSFLGDADPLPFVQFDLPIAPEAQDVEGLNVEFFATVASEGSSSVTERGFVWSLTDGPTIADNKVISGSGLGSYSAIITFPTLDTEFFIRPYATNTEGTSYGTFEAVSWTTSYDPMIFSTTTTAPTETSVPFITNSLLNRSVNARIDWGDGSAIETFNTTTNSIGSITHEYAVAGTYDVRISGEFPRLGFNPTYLTEFKQWGTQPWQVLVEAFRFCNFVCSATDIPVLDKDSLNTPFTGATLGGGLFAMFEQTGPLFTGVPNINSWDVSNIGAVYYMFSNSSFNSDISNWTLSPYSSDPPWNNNVYITFMFDNNTSYNQNLDSLDVSNVIGFSNMFKNTDLTASGCSFSTWNVSNGISFSSMFVGAAYIPTGIGSWTFHTNPAIQGVVFTFMFEDSTGTIPDITGWNTSSAYSFSYMFRNTSFNQDISGWDMTAVNSNNTIGVNIGGMLYNTPFNQDISTWDISNIRYGFNFMRDVTTFSTANYDNLLIGWEAQLPNDWGGVSIHFGSSQYTETSVDSGTTDGTGAGKLIQSGQNFLTTVSIGDIVHNTTNDTYAEVTNIDSDTELTLDNDIIVSGENYTIQSSNSAKARYSMLNTYGWTIIDGGPI